MATSRARAIDKSSDLKAEASISDSDVSISNTDMVDCSRPKLVIVTGPAAGYVAIGPDIAPKQIVSVPYTEFVNAEGNDSIMAK